MLWLLSRRLRWTWDFGRIVRGWSGALRNDAMLACDLDWVGLQGDSWKEAAYPTEMKGYTVYFKHQGWFCQIKVESHVRKPISKPLVRQTNEGSCSHGAHSLETLLVFLRQHLPNPPHLPHSPTAKGKYLHSVCWCVLRMIVVLLMSSLWACKSRGAVTNGLE